MKPSNILSYVQDFFGDKKSFASLLEKLREEYAKEVKGEENEPIQITFVGASGVGKSSLITNLTSQTQKPVVGPNANTTKDPQIYIFNGSSTLKDLPGYDTEEFPIETFIDVYKLHQEDLIVFVFSDKIRKADSSIVTKLIELEKPIIFVRNKKDAIYQPDKTNEELEAEIAQWFQEQFGITQKIVFTSTKEVLSLDQLQKAIVDKLSAGKKERWVKTAKAYSQEFLLQKKAAAMKIVYSRSATSALNGMNPIPGLDIAVDLGIIMEMLNALNKVFEIDESLLKKWEGILKPEMVNIVRTALKSVGKDAVIGLIKRYAGREAVKEATKWIPFVGQATSAALGFGICYVIGKKHADDCFKIAEAILAKEIKQGK